MGTGTHALVTPERIERFKFLKAEKAVLFKTAESTLSEVRYNLVKSHIQDHAARAVIEETIQATRTALHERITSINTEIMAFCQDCPDVVKLCGGIDLPEAVAA